jgi:predicted nuclease with TOPRIM domain
MTNEEAIKVLKTSSWMCLSNNSIKFQEAIEHAYNNLKRIKTLSEENTKLKAEIEQLKEIRTCLLNENVQLKSELEQLVKLPCKVGDKYILIFNQYGELYITTGWELIEITIVADDILLDFYCYATEESEQRSLDSFEKTIFNTEEEAEQSLKGIL